MAWEQAESGTHSKERNVSSIRRPLQNSTRHEGGLDKDVKRGDCKEDQILDWLWK